MPSLPSLASKIPRNIIEGTACCSFSPGASSEPDHTLDTISPGIHGNETTDKRRVSWSNVTQNGRTNIDCLTQKKRCKQHNKSEPLQAKLSWPAGHPSVSLVADVGRRWLRRQVWTAGNSMISLTLDRKFGMNCLIMSGTVQPFLLSKAISNYLPFLTAFVFHFCNHDLFF